MSPPALAGRRVVVTRPAGQTAHLAALIRAAGGEPVLFPALEILDAENLQPLAALVERLEAFDLAIFVSANAVDKALALVQARRAWPAGLRVATVGRGSERALERHGFAAVIAPGERFDSEALLALPELKDVAGKRVVIFRGDGGRELLGDTLAARGATVEYAECYRRSRPKADTALLLALWQQRQLDAFTVTSSEGLTNLHDMLGEAGRQCLKNTPLYAPHERIAAAARALGVQTVVLTGPGDEGLVAGLAAFFAKV
ncbi:MAG: uroporphyrinogen-III synthase [Betaproteobacteria bacterium]|nr:uroporphyrinogen-III synthase [Betaproteobacteria bacterium]